MEFIFWVLGICCFIYYGVIVAYAGFGTSFAPIWLILGLLLLLASVGLHFYGRIRERVPLWLEVGVVTAAAAFFAVFVIVELSMGFHFFSLRKDSADYAIVLGARVKGDEPGKALQYRMEKALEYARIHPNTIMILSGGQGRGESRSEAEIMFEFLVANGIPEYQLIREDRSKSTYENLVYSKLIIEARERDRRETLRRIMAEAGYLIPPESETPIKVAVITSNYHVMRAKGIARKIGLPETTGIASRSDPVLFAHFCVRECFAILKDKFVGNM